MEAFEGVQGAGAGASMLPEEIDTHGGNIGAARKRFPNAPSPWIDLSTGISPIAYPIPALAKDDWARLPSTQDQEDLCSIAARRYGLPDPHLIVAAPGTQSVIQAIPKLKPGARVAVLGPTYGEHAQSWKRHGHDVSEVDDLASVGDADAVVIVNPNNPTGNLIPARELLCLAETIAARNGLLVVDEAFMDLLERDSSVVPLSPPATIVLRSFGKAYGLAGVRLGFAIAESNVAARLRSFIGPWAVSGPAITIGRCALADDEWIERARRHLVAETKKLRNLLMKSGCRVVGGTPLFQLASHPRACRVGRRLGESGIYVRQFSYEPTWIRFGIPGDNASWSRLERVLAQMRCDENSIE